MKDRREIEDLISNYAYHADSREAQKQAELFAVNATVNVYMGKDNKPVQVLNGRKELQKGFEGLNEYETTMHFNGQNTLTSLDDDKATGTVYCLAHHIKEENGKKTLLIMGIRYHDKYVKNNGNWLFSHRDLIIDWTDKRETH